MNMPHGKSFTKMSYPLPWNYNDGGAALAGYAPNAEDCVCRAFTIATGRPYSEVRKLILDLAKLERSKTRSTPRGGVSKQTTRKLAIALGMKWVPTMRIGEGCTTHLRIGELPETGTIVTQVTRHVCAIRDGVIQDTHDPSRDGNRCVYGYWILEEA